MNNRIWLAPTLAYSLQRYRYYETQLCWRGKNETAVTACLFVSNQDATKKKLFLGAAKQMQ